MASSPLTSNTARLQRGLSRPGLWIPLLVALPVLWALLPGGMPNTADGLVHYTRASEMVHAWQDGVLIPRWSENLGLGYGIPLFVYAPPLPYYLTAALHTLLGLPLDAAFKGMMATAVLIAAYGAYRLGATLLGAWAGAAATAALLYAPILLRELFVQGNIAQYLAWTFPPWAAWAVLRIYAVHTARGRITYAAALALALTGTLLSHNAAALILMGMIALEALILAAATRDGRGLLAAVAGSLFGLALSAWFWVPALLEGRYVALDRIVASDFRPRFIAWSELMAFSPRLDTGAINPYVPLTLGAVQAGLGAAGALLFIGLAASGELFPAGAPARRRTRRTLLGAGVFFTLFAAFSAWMATASSEPVWAVLPFVDLFEWPFRWHGFTALGLAWLAAFAVYGAGRLYRRAESAVAVMALLLLMGSALVNLYPHKLAPNRPWTPAEVVRFEVKTQAIGTTSLGEFNPIWVADRFSASPLTEDYAAGRTIDRLPRPLPPGATGRQTRSSVHRQEFSLNLTQPATLTLNLLYFPGWHATLDGAPLDIRPHAGSGLIDVDLPPGEHTLVLTFGGTPLRRAAAAVSVVAWLGLAAGAVVLGRRPRRDARPVAQPAPASGRAAILATAGVSAVLLLATITQAQRLQLHSPPDVALPAAQPLHIDFGDKLRLLGVDAPPAAVRAGETLTLITYWRALHALDEDYAIFLHLDDPISGETVATVDPSHPADIPTSGWATGLYVRVPLKLSVPVDADPIQYALRLGVVDRRTGDLLAQPGDPSDLYEAGRVWVESRLVPRSPRQGPQARFGDSVELLGAAFDATTGDLTLTWRAESAEDAVAGEVSIFVHLLDSEGNLLGQADGAPYANRYPVRAWRPGQIIEDRRPLAAAVPDAAQIERIAVGLYDTTSGVRLPAVDEQGVSLADDALLLNAGKLR